MRYSSGLPSLIGRNIWIPILIASCGGLMLLVLQFVFLRLRQRRIRKLGTSAPVVSYWLPFGLDLMFTIIRKFATFEFFEWTRGMLDVPGRTVEWHIMGTRLVLTDEPENLKAIMSTQFYEFEKGHIMHKTFYSVLGDSVFATDGRVWQANKNQLRPFLSKSRPTDLEITEQHVAQLIHYLEKPEQVDVYNLIDRLQLDVVTHVFCGESANSLQCDRQQFRDAMDTLLRFNTTRIVFGKFGLLFPDNIFAWKATKEVDDYMNQHVQKALSMARAASGKKPESDMTFMEAVASRSNPKEIKNQLVAVLLAGKDPVAITLSWAIYELSRHPQVVKKLQQEIRNTVGPDSLLDVNHLKNMPYLKNVVRETTRLYHPIGYNVRQAARDTTIPFGGGEDGKQPVTILKGAQVLYSTIGLHRRHDIVGADADEWRPERWETWTPETWQYVPFNHGPRTCLGRVFGQFQMEYTIARIVQEFDSIEACGREQQIKVEMNTKMAYPIICRFHRA